MELENLLLGLIDTIRGGDGNSNDLAGMITPVVTGLGPSLGGVGEALSGNAGGASVLGGLVTGRASALGVALPLLSLLGLTSRKASDLEPVSRFELPESNRVDLGFEASTGGLGRVDYGERQTLRPVSGGPAPQINIHVSALDSKSFLDRSDDIADAVRSAVLRSHSLSDALAED